MTRKQSDVALVYMVMGGEFYGPGGLPKYVRELANYCVVSASSYVKVKIVSRMGRIISIKDENPSISEIGDRGLSTLRYSSFHFMLSHLPNPLTVISCVLRLMKDIRNEHGFRKVIHVHDTSSSTLIAFILNRAFNIPFIVQIHGFPLKEQKIKLSKATRLPRNVIWFLTKTWHILAMRLIKSRASKLGISDVTIFLGYREDVIDLLQLMDVFLNLSESEAGISASQLEAMRAGLPSIVTPFTDIIDDGRDGIVVPFKDAQAVADAILRLYQGENLRREISMNASLKVQDLLNSYTWSSYVNRVIQVFRNVTKLS